MTYSVKTIYPQFKCLTAHRAIMKRIDTAGKNINTLYKYKDGKHRLKREEGNIHHKLMEALRIDKWWYLKSRKSANMVSKTEAKCAIFNDIYEDVKQREMSLYYKCQNEGMYGEDDLIPVMRAYGNQMAKKYPYLFGHSKLTIKNKNRAYDDWIKYEIWQSAKKENFYEAMLTRDEVLGMANSLPDEIVGEIFKFL